MQAFKDLSRRGKGPLLDDVRINPYDTLLATMIRRKNLEKAIQQFRIELGP